MRASSSIPILQTLPPVARTSPPSPLASARSRRSAAEPDKSADLSRLGAGERDGLSAAKARPAGPSERARASQSRVSKPAARPSHPRSSRREEAPIEKRKVESGKAETSQSLLTSAAMDHRSASAWKCASVTAPLAAFRPPHALERALVPLPEINALRMHARHDAHAPGGGVEVWMFQKTPREMRRVIRPHVQPRQTISRMTPCRFEKIPI